MPSQSRGGEFRCGGAPGFCAVKFAERSPGRRGALGRRSGPAGRMPVNPSRTHALRTDVSSGVPVPSQSRGGDFRRGKCRGHPPDVSWGVGPCGPGGAEPEAPLATQGRPVGRTAPVMRATPVAGPDVCLNFDSGTPECTVSAARVRELSQKALDFAWETSRPI